MPDRRSCLRCCCRWSRQTRRARCDDTRLVSAADLMNRVLRCSQRELARTAIQTSPLSGWTAATCGFATPTRRNRSKSSLAVPCATTSVSAAWRSCDQSIHIHTSGCEVSCPLSGNTTARSRSSPTGKFNFASGSYRRCRARGISWTGTTFDDGSQRSMRSYTARRRPVSCDPPTTIGCQGWPAD